jgi:hypothetical protein
MRFFQGIFGFNVRSIDDRCPYFSGKMPVGQRYYGLHAFVFTLVYYIYDQLLMGLIQCGGNIKSPDTGIGAIPIGTGEGGAVPEYIQG